MLDVGYYESPIGWLRIEASSTAVQRIDYVVRPPKNNHPTGYILTVIKQLTEYFAGQRQQFDLNLERSATSFTSQVWRALEAIPYGQVKTYGQVASELAHPRAARAVGNACHINPLAIIVPCHRVVGTSPQAGGYASGVWRKQWLLEHEANHVAN